MSTTTTIIEGPEEDEKLDVEAMAIDDLCWRWASWSRTRKLFGPPPIAPGILGKLTRKGTGARRGGPPDAVLSPELAALNLAIAQQPRDTARVVFEMHYVHQVGPVKLAAEALGISRATWYRLLGEFRTTIHAAHQVILAENIAAREELPSAPDQQ